jgi:hypothetical protein
MIAVPDGLAHHCSTGAGLGHHHRIAAALGRQAFASKHIPCIYGASEAIVDYRTNAPLNPSQTGPSAPYIDGELSTLFVGETVVPREEILSLR